MILQGYQRLAAPGGVIERAGFLTRVVWTIRGAVQAFGGTPLPYGIGDWYWIPSRAIPAPGEVEPITEFPFFTVLYGDLHAHLFALPVALFVIVWVISVVTGRANFKGVLGWIVGLSLGGLAIGAMYPLNLSDIYTYLPLGLVAIGYALVRYHTGGTGKWLPDLSSSSKRILITVGAIALLIALSFMIYMPYRWWYGQAYSSVEMWKGLRTPLSSYLIHWGLFLFLIVSWMMWETRQWLASTPLSSLRKLEPYKLWIELAGLLLILSVFVFLFLEVWIVWLVLPLAVWAGVLIFRPGLPDEKRIVLFLFGTSLVITLMVEVIVVRGDIGRMNTVFKFYLQGWTMLAVSAAAALGWTLQALPAWYSRWRNAWQFVVILLVAGAALYPLLGGLAKIEDRMAPEAPNTLDGMAFMPFAEYTETWGVMDLSEDYNAIRWMQENIEGSPVIVEANLRNLYRWGSRFSIYTGLPGVVGWEWHQQQQRALLPGNWVSERIAEVDNFYTTTDVQQALDFLQKYNVRYVVLGQQERGHYAGEGLEKFPREDGILWHTVFADGETVIYEVSEQ
jgi:YYY domain-containing protein